jgi:uncharacterized protein with PIN domain
MGALENKTLRTKCAKCGAELPTFVDPEASTRQTWPLVGIENGKKQVFAACTKCYQQGWRPPGFTAGP